MRPEIPDRGSPIDSPVEFRLIDLAPGESVVVRARWRVQEVEFESSAEFAADDEGVVAPGEQPSLAGSYTGTDPYGMWWSAHPSVPAYDLDASDPINVELTASAPSGTIAFTLTRTWTAADVVTSPVDDGGLVGVYHRPAGDGPLPAVMVFGGSGGGLATADRAAGLLAGHGFATLALAYFAMPGLPSGLVDIPLEYFQRGLQWLLERAEVQGASAGVVGTSRGGELALLLGATFAEVGAVVANVPSGVVWPGFGPGSTPETPAWRLRGEPVPMLALDAELVAAVESTEPLVTTPAYEAALVDADAVRAAEIAVERTRGPILLLSGKDDPVWPSEALATIAYERAGRQAFGFDIEHVACKDAGHMCTRHPGLPTPLQSPHPVDGALCANGGTASANAYAQDDCWQRTIAFLHASLRR